ncbi:MAG: helix-turn-helix domain-containing protein [Oscillospiraceae bacterium]|nr:helix-turn-helix domain-containing protein [Oscillospiraceae bacterium]
MEEFNEYEIIKELADHGGNKRNAAKKLGCSKRTIDRHIAGYKSEGKAYFIHGNRGRKPVNSMSEDEKQDILDLYRNKYFEANFAHFTELLVNAGTVLLFILVLLYASANPYNEKNGLHGSLFLTD